MAYIPRITDLKMAIQLYYSRIELTNTDIKSLFGIKGHNVVNRLKNKAIEKMEEKKCPSWDAKTVNTECAFEAWGMNISNTTTGKLILLKPL